MLLTDRKIRETVPDSKDIKLSDGDGLYLLVRPNGARWWRMRFSVRGVEKQLSLGVYPLISLKRARERREDLRRQVAEGIDPSAMRKAEKRAQAQTFEAVAREWMSKRKAIWSSEYANNMTRRFEQHVFPWLGSKPIKSLTAADVLEVLERIEKTGKAETAHRARSSCGDVFRFAVATRRADRDPTIDLKGALMPVRARHFPSVKRPEEVGALMRAIEGYDAKTIPIRAALRLLPLVFVRPGELRLAQWEEFDLAKAEWRIPGERMKMRSQHLVPLSRQALEILKELYPLTGPKGCVFPSILHAARPISDNTINSALRRLGYERHEMTAHGFRSIASTLLNEKGWNSDAIERQLSHGERNKIRGTYNFAEYLPERRKMMQAWADYLDELRMEKVVPAIDKAA
jgi:integrase